jgi:hypothetical protein
LCVWTTKAALLTTHDDERVRSSYEIVCFLGSIVNAATNSAPLEYCSISTASAGHKAWLRGNGGSPIVALSPNLHRRTFAVACFGLIARFKSAMLTVAA